MAQWHETAPPAGMQDGAQPLQLASVMNFVAAILSLALLAGVCIWSYRLMVRDVSGVPVIQALDGPMRVSPEYPGGRRAPHLGLAVNAVAASGTAAPAAETVSLAPAPADLEPEDRLVFRPEGDALAAAARHTAAAPDPAPQDDATAPEGRTADAPGPLPSVIPARSPVPPRRPADAAARVAAAQPAGAGAGAGTGDATAEAVLQDIATRLSTGPAVTDIDPDTLAPGTRLVQFGAYDDEDEARAMWEQLSQQFPGMLDGRGRVIEQAVAGGSTFYRLRAHGFDGEPQARRFCAEFTHRQVDCIPVLVR